MTTSAQLKTAPRGGGRGVRVANRRDGPRAAQQPQAREAAPPERKPAARRGAHRPPQRPRGGGARLRRPEGPPRPSPRLGLQPPPAPRRRARARPAGLPGPEPRRAPLTHLSFSVPKMDAKYSAISHPPPPPPLLPTPPTLPDARGRRHPDATTLAPPLRRGGAAQSGEPLPARGRGLARGRHRPLGPGSPRAARRRPLMVPALLARWAPRPLCRGARALRCRPLPRPRPVAPTPRSPRARPLGPPAPGSRARWRRPERRPRGRGRGVPDRVGGFR